MVTDKWDCECVEAMTMALDNIKDASNNSNFARNKLYTYQQLCYNLTISIRLASC